jgi:hypothetical protein
MAAPLTFLEGAGVCALDALECFPAEDPNAVALSAAVWFGTTWSFCVFAVFAAAVVMGFAFGFLRTRVCTAHCECLRIRNGSTGTDSVASMAAICLSMAAFSGLLLCARDKAYASPAAVVSAMVGIVVGGSAALFVLVGRCLVLSHTRSLRRGDVWVDMTNPVWWNGASANAAAPSSSLNQAEDAVSTMSMAFLICGLLVGGGLGCGWADAMWPSWPLVPRVIVYSFVILLSVAFSTTLQEVSAACGVRIVHAPVLPRRSAQSSSLPWWWCRRTQS